MFRRLRLAWARAKTLSVLQTAYEMPLHNPLNSLDEADLRVVTEAAFDTGGNAFDAAAAFMTYRIKSALQAQLQLGKEVDDAAKDVGRLAVGIARTRNFMKFYRAHMNAVSEITQLKQSLAARNL